MKEIKKRIKKNGKPSYTACVRVKGYKSMSKTFERLTDAREWAAKTESELKNKNKENEQTYDILTALKTCEDVSNIALKNIIKNQFHIKRIEALNEIIEEQKQELEEFQECSNTFEYKIRRIAEEISKSCNRCQLCSNNEFCSELDKKKVDNDCIENIEDFLEDLK